MNTQTSQQESAQRSFEDWLFPVTGYFEVVVISSDYLMFQQVIL